VKLDAPLNVMVFGVEGKLVDLEGPAGLTLRSLLLTTLDSLLDGPFGWSSIRLDDICAADARFAGLSGDEALVIARGAGGVRPASEARREGD
jgi:hypothetical protein